MKIDVVAPRKARRVKVQLRDFDGNVLQKRVLKDELVYQLDEQFDERRVFLQVQYGKMSRNYYFVYPKDLNLPETTIERSVTKEGDYYLITLKSNKLAKDVRLSEQSGILGHFSDNYFDLRPGESKTVVFAPAVPVSAIQFEILSLEDVLGSQYVASRWTNPDPERGACSHTTLISPKRRLMVDSPTPNISDNSGTVCLLYK